MSAIPMKTVAGQDLDGPPSPKRPCEDCSLCCKLLPVSEIKKPRGKWCPHARPGAAAGACSIYADRPESCRLWSCIWVLDDTLPEALKPNRCHVVFDMMVDEIFIEADGVVDAKAQRVVQAWLDPAYPDAHRAPEVRRLVEHYAKKYRAPTMFRVGTAPRFRAFVVIAPPLSHDGKWHEKAAMLDPSLAHPWELR